MFLAREPLFLGRGHNVAVNDERCGAFAADAYARVAGKPAVCDGTLGPGATNLVTGLVESLNAVEYRKRHLELHFNFPPIGRVEMVLLPERRIGVQVFGQEFGGYAACIRRGAEDVERAASDLLELNIGATAVGTGGPVRRALSFGRRLTARIQSSIPRPIAIASDPTCSASLIFLPTFTRASGSPGRTPTPISV